jgi:carnitine-CoA ligase
MTLQDTINHSHQRMVTGRDVPWILRQWTERTPDKPFLIWEPFDRDGLTWTYGELSRDVDAVAGALFEQCAWPVDFVIIHLQNSPEFIISWFACAQLGAIAVSTNTRSVARDIGYFADHVSAVGAVTQPAFAELVDEPARAPGRTADATTDLGIQFTSGTTSRPKAVLWTHGNAVWGAQMNVAHMRLTREDIAHVVLPMFYANAQSYSMLSKLWVGGTMVLQPKFSASRFWTIVINHNCTWLSIVLIGAKALLNSEAPKNHSFRFWGCSGNYPPIHEAFGIPTIAWWGMTETISHGIVSDVSNPCPRLCVGWASMEYNIRIDQLDGWPIEPGESGHHSIHDVRGISLFKEYDKNSDANAAAFDADGWFDTGDIIRMDEAGNLFFSDRDKAILRVGSENVAASEIETVIMETGWVTECAVIGQEHFMLDDGTVSFVIPTDGAPSDLRDQIITVSAEKLADYEVTREVIILDDMPRTTLDKISKVDLRGRLPAIET